MYTKEIVIDCKDHLMGRLASVVAKELLNGQRVTLVRCEGIMLTGSLVRNQMRYARVVRKTCNTNPLRGPQHHRCPAKVAYRTIRGMVPHKQKRGECAMSRLTAFEGIPSPYDKKKRVVIPGALRSNTLAKGRKHCNLGLLLSGYGWKHASLVERLEAKRIERAATWYKQKTATAKKVASTAGSTAAVDAKLAKLGY